MGLVDLHFINYKLQRGRVVVGACLFLIRVLIIDGTGNWGIN